MMWIICSEITEEWKKLGMVIIAFAVFDFKRSFFLAGASRDHLFFFKVLHEITASGVYADWPGPVGNGNRLRWQG